MTAPPHDVEGLAQALRSGRRGWRDLDEIGLRGDRISKSSQVREERLTSPVPCGRERVPDGSFQVPRHDNGEERNVCWKPAPALITERSSEEVGARRIDFERKGFQPSDSR